MAMSILNFYCTAQKKLHSRYHLKDVESGYKLTEIFEVHYLELPRLYDVEVHGDEDDPVFQWMSFIEAKSEEVLKMLAEKNEDIKKAYSLLKVISQDSNNRMLYEARQKAISDEKTRII